jgi:hypothetical protein
VNFSSSSAPRKIISSILLVEATLPMPLLITLLARPFHYYFRFGGTNRDGEGSKRRSGASRNRRTIQYALLPLW